MRSVVGSFETAFSDAADAPMKHPSLEIIILILFTEVTVLNGQFKWGTFLLKSNGEVQRLASFGWKSKR